MKKLSLFLFLCFSVIITLSGCNGIEKVLKSNDFDKKYEVAMECYNNNSYSKAIQLFENLIMYYRGRENAENILWYYSQSLMKEEDYYTAAYQFKRFAKQYPYSDRAEEAQFLSAYCKYREAPDYYLDQTQTREAVTEFEQFAERYPQSKHLLEVNAYLDEMRAKLMQKDYEIAYGYYHIEAYHAAYVSLQSFLNLYPESQYREEASFYLLRSGYEYAINSTAEKQHERLQQVINDFEKFSASFKNSQFIKEAQNIYTKTRAMLSEAEGR